MLELYNSCGEYCDIKPDVCYNTPVVNYYKRYLLQKAMSVFKFSGLPETWDLDYFMSILFKLGRVCVLETNQFGIIPQECTLSGYNIFYEPSKALVTNPLLPKLNELKIGQDCEIIKLQPDYGSIMDLITMYAIQLALCNQTITTNLLNSQDAILFLSKNKQGAESLKKAFDKVRAGEPAVCLDSTLFDSEGRPTIQSFIQNIGGNYIAGSVLDTQATIMNLFCEEIGIPNNGYEKKAQLTDDEVHMNDTNTFCKAILWRDTMKNSMDKVNKMFGLNLDVELRKMPQIIDPDITNPSGGAM